MDNKTNEMQLFTNEVFGNVRATEIEGKVWFVGKDVAEALGYKDTAQAIRTHCKGVGVLTTPLPTKGGIQQTKVINQRNVIRLIMRSNLPQAEQFQDWVEDEIIPSVLENGAYIDTSRADALPYVEEKLAEMEKIHEIDERYIGSLRQRIQQAVKDRNSAWQVQADRREIIDEMQRLINMLLEEKLLTKDEMKQLAKIEMLRELTGNMWVTK